MILNLADRSLALVRIYGSCPKSGFERSSMRSRYCLQAAFLTRSKTNFVVQNNPKKSQYLRVPFSYFGIKSLKIIDPIESTFFDSQENFPLNDQSFGPRRNKNIGLKVISALSTLKRFHVWNILIKLQKTLSHPISVNLKITRRIPERFCL